MSRKRPSIVLIERGPDEWGRSVFWHIFWTGSAVKGQIFRDNVGQHVREITELIGQAVQVFDVSTAEGLLAFGVESVSEAFKKAERLVGGPFRPTAGGLGAGLLIVHPDGERALLVRRSGEVAYPGQWSLPGGKVESGEEPIQAAIREAAEELGPLPRLQIPPDEGHWEADGPIYAFATFRANLDPADADWKPTLNPENDLWTWSIRNSLPYPLLRGTEEAIGDLLGRSGRSKPAQMGIVALKTFSVCKVVNLDEGSPFFLTLSIQILDETTNQALRVSIPFHDRMPQFFLLPFCRPTDIEGIMEHYRTLQLRDPALKISCVEGLSLEAAIENALEDVLGKAPPEAARAVEHELRKMVGVCF